MEKILDGIKFVTAGRMNPHEENNSMSFSNFNSQICISTPCGNSFGYVISRHTKTMITQ
jgi:hypothetical protein